MLDELAHRSNIPTESSTKVKADNSHSEKAPTIKVPFKDLNDLMSNANLSTNKILSALANSPFGPPTQFTYLVLLHNEAIIPEGSKNKRQSRQQLVKNGEGLSAPDATPRLFQILNLFRCHGSNGMTKLLENLDKNMLHFKEYYQTACTMFLEGDLESHDYYAITIPVAFYFTLRDKIACMLWCTDAAEQMQENNRHINNKSIVQNIASDTIPPKQKLNYLIEYCRNQNSSTQTISLTSPDRTNNEINKAHYFLESSAVRKTIETWNELYPGWDISESFDQLISALSSTKTQDTKTQCLQLTPSTFELLMTENPENTQTDVDILLANLKNLSTGIPAELNVSPCPSPTPRKKNLNNANPHTLKRSNSDSSYRSRRLHTRSKHTLCTNTKRTGAPKNTLKRSASTNSIYHQPIQKLPAFFQQEKDSHSKCFEMTVIPRSQTNTPEITTTKARTDKTPENTPHKKPSFFDSLRRRLHSITSSPSSSPISSPNLRRSNKNCSLEASRSVSLSIPPSGSSIA